MFSFSSLQDISSHVNTVSDLDKLCCDGSAKCICKCKSKRCQMKNIVSAQDKVVRTAEVKRMNVNAKSSLLLRT